MQSQTLAEAKRQMSFANYICQSIKERYGHNEYFKILEMANERMRNEFRRKGDENVRT